MVCFIECETDVRQLRKEKMQILRDNNLRVTFCFPLAKGCTRPKFSITFLRWKDVIDECWIFDMDLMSLFMKFKLVD